MGERLITCKHCYQDKPESAFSKHKLNADGETGKCKKCHAASMKKTREEKSDSPDLYVRKGAPIPEGYDDEYSFIAFCTPEEYIEWITRIGESIEYRYKNRRSVRGGRGADKKIEALK